MSDYVRWVRERVGHQPIQLTFAAACILDAGRVLLQCRGDDTMWCFPGGAVELGESIEDAVRREVIEETGFDIEVDAVQGIYSRYWHTYPNGDIAQPITTFLRCSIIGGALSAHDPETIDLRFCRLDTLPGPMMNQQHCDALTDLQAGRLGVLR
ncbi:NUDIX domain-containing protein [Nocardia sp. 004]|uniref:NUDIX domain-containing protein n=1 Tax=Nocardia sp. 004 TaxID=3385978 RepID=UPI00399FB574